MIKILSEWIGSEFKVDNESWNILGITYNTIVLDKEHISMLAPTPSNFVPPSEVIVTPLDSLNIVLNEDDETMVGRYKTVVKKKYVDGFIQTMKHVYNINWLNLRALIHRKEEQPLILTSNLWTFIVAPYLTSPRWVKGKYNPEV
jgi:hypothetical protein